jgi:hypothetical protein
MFALAAGAAALFAAAVALLLSARSPKRARDPA